MVVKCPNCLAQLAYNPEDGRLHCKHCNSFFSVDEIEISEEKAQDKVYEQASEEDTIEAKIYLCKSCGAELMINGVEAASFCAYCGQSTIIFDRVSKQKKPKFIIPFKITKEEAEAKIRRKIKKSKFIPEEIKEFKTDIIRGIYVPFWLVEMTYEDRMLIQGTEGSGKNSSTHYYLRNARSNYKRIPIDASKKFDDESSSRLEPFDYSQLVDFDINYLTGFYADCGDEDEWKVETNAATKARRLLQEEAFKTINASDKKVIESNPRIDIREKEYVLLPVWFLVFYHEGRNYTIMVNGVSGKLVGALPFDNKKTLAITSGLCISSALLFLGLGIIFGMVFRETEDYENMIKFIGAIAIGIFAIASAAIKKYDNFMRSRMLTEQKQIKEYVAERQEED